MNLVMLMGRLVRDPDIRWSQGQDSKPTARFTLAVDRRIKAKEGAQSADFISCVAFNKVAEFVEKYISKGIKVVITGRWQTGSYTDRNGNKVYTNDCIVESMEFAESKKSQAPDPLPETDADGFMNIPDGIDEEIPFK